MSSTFPDVDIPVSKRTIDWGKKFIDAVIGSHEASNDSRGQIIEKMYSSYNGVNRSTGKQFLEAKYGAALSTTYIDYKLGRTKVKLLLGESLDVKLNNTVRTINPKAKLRKMESAKRTMVMSMFANELKAVENRFGFSPGQAIPENKSEMAHLASMSPKEINELNMQRFIDLKIQNEQVRIKSHEALTDLILTSECHGRIERDHTGNDTLRIIPSDHAIFQENSNDPFCMRTPYSGEWRKMYLHDILLQWGDQMTEKERKQLSDSAENFQEQNTAYMTKENGTVAFKVWTVQWRTPRPFHTKISKNGIYKITLTPEYYESKEKQITKDVERGKYKVVTKYADDIYQVTRISTNVYVDFGRVEGQIQTRDNQGHYHGHFDYVHCLYGTVHGTRVSLQEIINNLSELYNVVMFMITRELKKMKGLVFTYDEAARPAKKDMKSVLFDIVEHGMVKFNSAEDSNYGQKEIRSASDVIQALDLGVSPGFRLLLETKSNLEYTMDRITGINSDREGWGRASQTATANMQNVEASRSITKDMFYYWNIFMEMLLTKLAEKTKTNWDWIDSDAGQLIFGPEGAMFLKATRDLTNDDYGVFLSDGRREADVKDRSRLYINQEINAGMLRSKDAIRYEMAETLNEGLAILDRAWKEIEQYNNQSNQSKEKIAQESQQMQIQLSREDREDRQQHEKDLVVLKEREKRATQSEKLSVQAKTDTDDIRSKERIANNNSNI